MTKRTPFPTSPTTADADQEQSESPRPVDTAVTPQADQRFSSDEEESTDKTDPEQQEFDGVTEKVSTGLTEEAIRRGIRAWQVARLSNSPLSRATDAWNVLQKQLPSLAAFIMKEVQ